MYAFKPEADESPKAVRMLDMAVIILAMIIPQSA
jgi:hypothetical protein